MSSILGDIINIDNTLTGLVDINASRIIVSDLSANIINGIDGSKLINLSNSTSDLQTQINSIVAGTPNTSDFVNITDTQTVGGQKSFSTAPLLTTTQVTATSNNLISKIYADTAYQPKTTTPVAYGFLKSTVASNTAIPASPSWLSIVSFTLPKAGTFLVIYTSRIASTSTSTTSGARMILFDDTGTEITDSAIYIQYLISPTGVSSPQTSGTGSYIATVSSSKTYSLRLQLAGTSANVINSSTGYNTVSFLEIASNGASGANGVNGTNGTNGVSPVLAVGTVTTLPSTSPATVVQSGTELAPIYSFGIPQGTAGTNGTNGAKGDKGDKGDTGDDGGVAGGIAGAISGTASGAISGAQAGAISGAQAGAISGAQAGATAGAQAGAESASTAYESRVSILENKTQGQQSYVDIDSEIHTTFKDNLEVTNTSGYTKISIDGNAEKITLQSTLIGKDYVTTPTILCNEFDAVDSYSSINIGKVSNQNVNIGNQLTAGIPLMETTINLYGKVNFGYNTVIGTILKQF